jgi:glucosamine-6-phosphate deaminase
MRLRIVEDYESLSLTAAQLISREIERLPALVLLPATGSTPTGAYHELARKHLSGELDASRITVVQLDEYAGIGPEDGRSLFGWMRSVLLEPLAIAPERVVRFDTGGDPAASCRDFEEAVRRCGGPHLAVLGLGPNGHLGFNEPPAGPSAPTRVVSLAVASLESNARYWGSGSLVPTHALTTGMDIILSIPKTLLLVSGSHKADVLRRTVEAEMSDDLPASHLRAAPDVTVIADRAAWPWGDEVAFLPDDVVLASDRTAAPT